MPGKSRRAGASGSHQGFCIIANNFTGRGPLEAALPLIPRDVGVLLGSEHHQSALTLPALEASFQRHGWRPAATPAVPKDGGTSGGTVAAVRSRFPGGLWPTASGPTLAIGRVSGASARVWLRSGLAFLSIYLVSGLGPVGENQDLLWQIAAWCHGVGCPIVVGGDWNMNPWQLEATGWPAVCGFFLCIPPAPTCGDAYLDYFAVSSVLRPFCSPVSLVDLHTRPHYGVRMDLGGSPGQDMYRALLAPKQLPVCRPIGCGFAPLPPFLVHADWRVGNAEQAAALATARWSSLVARIELEVLNACGIGGDVADAMSGRARGPSWQWRPVLDPRADVVPVGLASRPGCAFSGAPCHGCPACAAQGQARGGPVEAATAL